LACGWSVKGFSGIVKSGFADQDLRHSASDP
jgi:hypothetical protein